MNVITLASRKGGAGKSTLTAHLAACAHAGGYRSLVIDADPQGSVTLWHSLRRQGGPALQSATRGIERGYFCCGRRLRMGIHRYRTHHMGGRAGSHSRRYPRAHPGPARNLRS